MDSEKDLVEGTEGKVNEDTGKVLEGGEVGDDMSVTENAPEKLMNNGMQKEKNENVNVEADLPSVLAEESDDHKLDLEEEEVQKESTSNLEEGNKDTTFDMKTVEDVTQSNRLSDMFQSVVNASKRMVRSWSSDMFPESDEEAGQTSPSKQESQEQSRLQQFLGYISKSGDKKVENVEEKQIESDDDKLVTAKDEIANFKTDAGKGKIEVLQAHLIDEHDDDEDLKNSSTVDELSKFEVAAEVVDDAENLADSLDMKKKKPANEEIEAVQASLEDSNLANYGSKEHHGNVKAAAETDVELRGCGKGVGLEIWRVENKKKTVTKNEYNLKFEDVLVQFGVKRWPKGEYGKFYEGDSYIVLNTYKDRSDPETKDSDKLAYDVHFWLGKESTIDEKGVAAYKTVEIDELLDGVPIQHREIQGHESALFLSYFKNGSIQYLKGGIDSGFNEVYHRNKQYNPKLLLVKQHRKTVRAVEIPMKFENIYRKNCYILDLGSEVIPYYGSESKNMERFQTGVLVNNLVNARFGRTKKISQNKIFDHLIPDGLDRGSEAHVELNEPSSVLEKLMLEPENVDRSSLKVFRISDESGELKFEPEEVSGNKFKYSFFEEEETIKDVFLVHSNVGIFVWVGKLSSEQEKNKCMDIADKYIRSQGIDETFPVTRLLQKQAKRSNAFRALFA